jgi:hypothetical protein
VAITMFVFFVSSAKSLKFWRLIRSGQV